LEVVIHVFLNLAAEVRIVHQFKIITEELFTTFLIIVIVVGALGRVQMDELFVVGLNTLHVDAFEHIQPLRKELRLLNNNIVFVFLMELNPKILGL